MTLTQHTKRRASAHFQQFECSNTACLLACPGGCSPCLRLRCLLPVSGSVLIGSDYTGGGVGGGKRFWPLSPGFGLGCAFRLDRPYSITIVTTDEDEINDGNGKFRACVSRCWQLVAFCCFDWMTAGCGVMQCMMIFVHGVAMHGHRTHARTALPSSFPSLIFQSHCHSTTNLIQFLRRDLSKSHVSLTRHNKRQKGSNLGSNRLYFLFPLGVIFFFFLSSFQPPQLLKSYSSLILKPKNPKFFRFCLTPGRRKRRCQIYVLPLLSCLCG
jgi:hypothetical protein